MFIMIMWVVVYQIEQNDHRRDQRACALYLCYASPSVRLGLRLLWTLCLLPSEVDHGFGEQMAADLVWNESTL